MFFHDLIQSSWSEGEGVMNRCCWRVTYLHFSYLYSSYPSFRLHEGFLQAQFCKNQLLNPKLLQNFSENMRFFLQIPIHVTSRVIHLHQQLPVIWELDAPGLQQDDSQLFAENCILKGGELFVGENFGAMLEVISLLNGWAVVGFPEKTIPGKMGNAKWDLVGFSFEFHELPNMIFNR